MKAKAVLFILIVLGSVKGSAKELSLPANSGIPALSKIINSGDTLIFDLANATLTPTYIDLPIYALSDDVLFGIDYAIQFNQAKLTYSTTIDLIPASTDPTILSLAHYNPTNLYLKYSSTTLQSFPATSVNPIVYITSIRFMLSAPCISVSSADFYNITPYLNGVQCAYKLTNLNFSQFIPSAAYVNGPICLNSNVQFTDSSTVQTGSISAWLWNFGNGTISNLQNPTTVYTATGSTGASLIVTTSIGCTDTIIHPFNINPVPVNSFTYAFDCLKDSVFFTNSSSISSGTLSGFLWSFGDASNISSLADPSHHYNASGSYTASLTSISGFSCSTTTTLQVLLNNKISASFTTASVNNCLGSVINFSDASSYSSGTINAWNWDFGDGSASTQQNPSHTYASPNTYSITLTSTGTDGCKGNITQIVIINPLPTVQFTASTVSVCANVSVGFNDLSTAVAGSTYFWYFGDGTSSNVQNPAHTYLTGGQYPVKLVVTTPGGCADSLTKSAYLDIIPAPTVNFSLSTYCILSPVNFINNTAIPTGSVTSWSWDFGDTHTSTAESPVNTYSLSGNYTVSLVGTSNLGCVGTYSQAIAVSPKPTVNFNYTSSKDCSGETLDFNNLSTTATGVTYLWRFESGGTSVQQNPSYTYSVSGSYAIELIVNNPGGCSDSLIKPYSVSLPLPATALFSDTIVANAMVSFSSHATNATSISWDFGDNQTATEDNPTHKFADVGTFQVCLTAYNSLHCPTISCKELYVGLSSIVAIPSGFTPNADNVNDVLRVRGGPFAEMEFQVLNEWGNLLFSSASQSNGWDGSYKGEAQPVGIYEYIFKGTTVDDKKISLYGVVNLTR